MRCTTFSLAMVLFIATGAFAQQMQGMPPAQAANAQPFKELTSPVEADRDVVRMYFSFSCPFSLQAHEPIERWGRSLPRPLKYEITPVVTGDMRSLMGAAYYYAVKTIKPAAVPAFVANTFEAIQKRHEPADKPQTYRRAAERAGVTAEQLDKIVKSSSVEMQTRRAALLVGDTQLTETPTLVIGGLYLVTPEATLGVNGNFVQLINATTSKYMIERGIAP